MCIRDRLEPDEEFHVVRFQEMAKQAMEKIYANGHIPIVVGGTGFYIPVSYTHLSILMGKIWMSR